MAFMLYPPLARDRETVGDAIRVECQILLLMSIMKWRGRRVTCQARLCSPTVVSDDGARGLTRWTMVLIDIFCLYQSKSTRGSSLKRSAVM